MEEKRHSPWVAATTCSAFTLLFIVLGGWAMHAKLTASIEATVSTLKSKQEKLSGRIDTLQHRAEEIASTSPEKIPEIETIQHSITEHKTLLDSLQQRIDVIDKKTEIVPTTSEAKQPASEPTAPLAQNSELAEPIALKTAVLSGNPFANELQTWLSSNPKSESVLAPLVSFSPGGLPTEEQILSELHDILDRLSPPKPPEDVGLVGKINTHLKGLVQIKKAEAADPYLSLRQSKEDLATLEKTIKRMPEALQSPFTNWLARAASRNEALDALKVIAP